LKALETVADKTHSSRACNTLGEFYQVQDRKDNYQENAAKYYNISAEQGCQVGTHWMGVFYHIAFGVGKNVEKAIEYLTKSARAGNGQSCYQLFLIYYQEEGFKDVVKAYQYLEKGIMNGCSHFDELHALFKEH
jgi:TPR repeat protein